MVTLFSISTLSSIISMKLFAATKAFLVHEGKILLLRESTEYKDGANAGKFDVVGGRIEPGQRFDESLLREIKEETGLEATIGQAFHIDEWRPVVRGEEWQIIGTYIECTVQTPEVTLSKDHAEYQWIDPKNHRDYALIESIHGAFDAYIQLQERNR